MIIGLIAWNIAITFVLLIVIIAVICVCVEMDTRKRYGYQSGAGFAGPHDGEDNGSSSIAGHAPQMRELRDDESEYYKIGSIGCDQSLGNVRF